MHDWTRQHNRRAAALRIASSAAKTGSEVTAAAAAGAVFVVGVVGRGSDGPLGAGLALAPGVLWNLRPSIFLALCYIDVVEDLVRDFLVLAAVEFVEGWHGEDRWRCCC